MSNGNERKPERGHERTSLSNTGPQYVPIDFLDENYHYRWVNYHKDKLWTAIEKERLGYEPVSAEEFSGQIKSKIIDQKTMISEGYVTCPLKNGSQAVLMKIDRKAYLERKKQDHINREASYRDASLADLEMESMGTKSTFSFTNTK